MLLIEAGAEHQLELGAAALPGEGDALLVRRLSAGSRVAPSAGPIEHPVPAAVIDRVVAQIAAQPTLVRTSGKRFCASPSVSAGKASSLPVTVPRKTSFTPSFGFGQGELQPLLDFLLRVAGFGRLELDRGVGHRLARRVFGKDLGVENRRAMVAEAQRSALGVPTDFRRTIGRRRGLSRRRGRVRTSVAKPAKAK